MKRVITYYQTITVQVLLTLILIIAIISVNAQNDPLISQQGLQRFIYNPASTGTTNYHQIGFIHRNQWNGFPEAPSGNILTAHTYFPGYSLGLGLVVIEDKIGLEHNLNLKSAYAYHVWLNEKNVLSFGVTAGIFSKRFDLGKLVLEEYENLNVYQLENSVVADFDFGIEYQRKNFILGGSMTHLLNSFEGSNNIRHPRHIHTYAHYIQPVSYNFLIRAIVSHYNVRNVNGFEITAIGELEEHFWAGISHRIDESVTFLGGVYVQPKIRIGYSYDWNLNMLKRYSTGSHEVFAHFMLNKKEVKSKSPRFFN
jgi:type IX secretion system PorP/SprF family membrane protein